MNHLYRTLNNRNWDQVFAFYDEDGFCEYDPTEREKPENVRKFVTIDGEIFQFVYRTDLPWYRRIKNEISALFVAIAKATGGSGE